MNFCNQTSTKKFGINKINGVEVISSHSSIDLIIFLTLNLIWKKEISIVKLFISNTQNLLWKLSNTKFRIWGFFANAYPVFCVQISLVLNQDLLDKIKLTESRKKWVMWGWTLTGLSETFIKWASFRWFYRVNLHQKCYSRSFFSCNWFQVRSIGGKRPNQSYITLFIIFCIFIILGKLKFLIFR
jgi:hypothetical protein